jgi:L-fuculose-phosphate aldolase
MVISPSGKDYDTIELEDVMVTDLKGKVIEGRCKPSSEWRMHGIFYEKRGDINSVVHTHSINAAAISCLRIDLPLCLLYCGTGRICGGTLSEKPCGRYTG